MGATEGFEHSRDVIPLRRSLAPPGGYEGNSLWDTGHEPLGTRVEGLCWSRQEMMEAVEVVRAYQNLLTDGERGVVVITRGTKADSGLYGLSVWKDRDASVTEKGRMQAGQVRD